ncbi:hypothetical protein PCS_00769 [Desulfocurvibacter africanus PCS]|uniref:Uncharacterized protein n=1 Tax=Desulfocurvibacter africanus PCS TaxID=1262666 RepID=M5Q2I1_DESAF|nr:hypothetical protein [Desulfocurvibacter africanus]EMG38471.1 hypothetical protein PCS_00769 [Desulfocurvibacter africanus PCS]
MFIYDWANTLFDGIRRLWDHKATQGALNSAMIVAFLLAVAAAGGRRLGLIPQSYIHLAPDSVFNSVDVVLTFMLVMGVFRLILIMPCSFSKAMGEQFQLMSLLLLRSAFKALSDFPDPIQVEAAQIGSLGLIMADGVGSLLVFVLLGLFRRYREPSGELQDGASLYSFVSVKKIVALVLLVLFLIMACRSLWGLATIGSAGRLFESFYTLLILGNILLMLVSQRHMPSYRSTFRNTGFSLATLFLLLALASPPLYKPALGVAAALFALLVTLAHRAFRGSPGAG